MSDPTFSRIFAPFRGFGLAAAALALTPPVISLTSGSGYAGSVLTSTRPGQWYADDVAIPGQTGLTYTQTLANEPKGIRCGDSNTIQMWTPDAVSSGQKTNGGWYGGGLQTEAGGKVTAWPDRFGVRDQAQATAANQPAAGIVNGKACAVWPSTDNDCGFAPAAAFAPAYWLIVAQYKTGTEVNTATVITGVVTASNPGRICLSDAGAGWWANNTPPVTQSRKNAGDLSASVLPLPMSLLEFMPNPAVGGGSVPWRIGTGQGALGRSWQGTWMLAIALGEVPTGDTLARIQGYAAHSCGIAASLPADHPYKTNAPRIS